MKKIFSIIAMAALMLSFAACTEKEDQPDQGGQNGNNTNATMLVGNWLVDQLTYNGQQLPMQDEMTIVMNANGTGEILENGQSHNNNFTWSVSENILTVTPGEESYTFTISGLTATECTLHGDVIPATDMRGDVVMHMTKQNGQPGPGPEPNPEDFPAGTAWEWSMDSTISGNEGGMTYAASFSISIQVAFAATGNTGTVTEHMEREVSINGTPMPEYGTNDTETEPMTWTYDATTQTGVIIGQDTDEETGEVEDVELPFTYDASRNVIII